MEINYAYYSTCMLYVSTKKKNITINKQSPLYLNIFILLFILGVNVGSVSDCAHWI